MGQAQTLYLSLFKRVLWQYSQSKPCLDLDKMYKLMDNVKAR